MDIKIDFSSYSLAELRDAQAAIDREQYPQRAEEIDALIAQKRAEQPESAGPTQSKTLGELASRGDRFIAALVDGVIGLLAAIPIFMWVGLESFKAASLIQLLAFLGYGMLVTLLLHGYLLHHYGQTIGKRLMAIRIETLDGKPANLKRVLLLRLLPMQVINCIPFVGQLLVGLINPLFIFGKNRRCLHDYFAKTQVCNWAQEQAQQD